MKKRKNIEITKRTQLTIETAPCIGLTIGIMKSSRSNTLVVLLPFVMFELEIDFKTKKSATVLN